MSRLLILACLALLAVIPNPTCERPEVRITPNDARLSPGERQQFTLVLRDGSTPVAARWFLFRGPGIITDGGLYKAPYHVPHEIVAVVRAHPGGERAEEHVITNVVLEPGSFARADSCCSETQQQLPEPQAPNALDSEPELLVSSPPVYPESALARGVEGRVVAGALVCRDGTVLDTWVFQSIEGLDEAVEAALRRFEFRPGMLAGEGQAAWFKIPFRFTLADSSVTMELEEVASSR